MKISTLFVVLGLVIISLYCFMEVDYYVSYQEITKNTSDVPYLTISKIGLEQAINNKSINYGVYHEPASATPGSGTVILFGHRTLHGSPFLNLDKLTAGDNITVEWPGIGDVDYTVMNSTIVPASYRMSVDQGNVLFLITCYPLGSSAERLIIEAKQGGIYPIQKTEQKANPQAPYAPLIILGFFLGGTFLSYIYPVKDERIIIFIAIIALTLFLVVEYFFQLPTDGIESALSNINNFLGV
jgi:sortase A